MSGKLFKRIYKHADGKSVLIFYAIVVRLCCFSKRPQVVLTSIRSMAQFEIYQQHNWPVLNYINNILFEQLDSFFERHSVILRSKLVGLEL